MDCSCHNSTEVVILGTIHSAHSTNDRYSAARVNEVLLALHPAAICVELYSRFFHEDGSLREEILVGSDCPEISAINDAAKELGIRQIPFDIEGRNEFFQETNYFEREDSASVCLDKWITEARSEDPRQPCLQPVMTLRAIHTAQQCFNKYAPPEAINCSDFDDMIENKNLAGEALTGLCARSARMAECVEFWNLAADYWQRRNRAMADNIVRIASEFPGGRLAVATGCEHRYILREHLSKEPAIVLREFWEVL